MKKTTRTKPSLWNKVVSEVKSSSKGGDPGEWSARKAQLATQTYKKRGGGYEGSKSSDNSLTKWTKQKWRTSDGGPSEGKKRYLPDKAWSSLSSQENKETNRAKAEGNRKGKQFVPQPKSVAKKAAKYRN